MQAGAEKDDFYPESFPLRSLSSFEASPVCFSRIYSWLKVFVFTVGVVSSPQGPVLLLRIPILRIPVKLAKRLECHCEHNDLIRHRRSFIICRAKRIDLVQVGFKR